LNGEGETNNSRESHRQNSTGIDECAKKNRAKFLKHRWETEKDGPARPLGQLWMEL